MMGKSALRALSVCIVLLSGPSLVHAQGNAAAGKEKSEPCAGCHGEDGNSNAPIFPKLAGQHASYLAKQLHEFKTEKRVNPTMTAMAEPLSDEDIDDIAAFYAQQKITVEKAEAPNALGEAIYRTGNASSGVPACTGCHGPDGSGIPSARFPALRGQYAAYLEKTLNDFKSGERANDANSIMRAIAAKLSDEEIAAVSSYTSGLR
ncbi:c-type cytochrome [Methylocaldum szegediense]|jgi:cytochrome c553|uniref:Cytochrome c4 n=1 Tax=Methylocaldum szegediense TaxID=73780 RepID=A0ABM9I713_9GAMM|nr:c-type cytochrome [Methylocaldum szegediense]CAI8930215.1 Cytochrome c4 [Methylocaldum szegediense]